MITNASTTKATETYPHYVIPTPEEHVKFLQEQLLETVRRKSSIERRYNALRRRKGPRLIVVDHRDSTTETIDLQADQIAGLLEETAALSERNEFLELELEESKTKNSYNEELATLFESEVDELQAENDQLKELVYQLKSQIIQKESFSFKSETGKPVLTMGTETDLYPGEQKDLILELLQDALKSAPQNTRRRDILESIISANPENGTRRKMKNTIKGFFKNFTKYFSNRSTRKVLEELGIEFIAKGDGHPRVKFMNDDRYVVITPSTPSDSHSGLNTYFTIIDRMF